MIFQVLFQPFKEVFKFKLRFIECDCDWLYGNKTLFVENLRTKLFVRMTFV